MSDQDNIPTIPRFGVKLGRPSNAERQRALSKPGPKPKSMKEKMASIQSSLVLTSGRSIVNKIVQIALDDNHPSQAMMLKVLAERIIPASAFDPNAGQNGARAIEISITGTDGSVTTVKTGGNALEALEAEEARTIDAEDIVIRDAVVGGEDGVN